MAYGSRYQSTEDIAKNIAKYLEEKENLEVFVVNLRKLSRKSWPIVETGRFDALIVGTGIRVARWTKETTLFLKINKRIIHELNLPLGFFISCGYASDPSHYPIAMKQFIENRFTKLGIHPDIYEAFGGVFDFSPTSPYSHLDKQILKMGSRDLVMKIDFTQRNDYRDWNRIYKFADRFVSKLIRT
ncbi:MAG: flavodoxin domain-containing protein [Candidatus Hodarchaeales archaeon]|jgi:menaquinone-dependent protoporphyrinogen oxidase